MSNMVVLVMGLNKIIYGKVVETKKRAIRNSKIFVYDRERKKKKSPK